MSEEKQRRVRVLINPRSGLWWSFDALRRGLDTSWDVPPNDLSYQFCQSVEDSLAKTRRAIAEGVALAAVPMITGLGHEIDESLAGTAAPIWTASGLDAAQIDALGNVSYQIADLGGQLADTFLIGIANHRHQQTARRVGRDADMDILFENQPLVGRVDAGIKAFKLLKRRGTDFHQDGP